MKNLIVVISCVLVVTACKFESRVVEKRDLETYVIQNKHGAFAKVTNLGGIIMELHIPKKDGTLRDVVLGFKEPSEYLNKHPYFGAIVGRYGNRIAGGEFNLHGKSIQLSQNEKTTTLHGGEEGFDKRLWTVTSQSKSHIVFSLKSPDGDQGFPGTLDIRVKYMMDNDNQFRINYRATTDQSTVVNLTNHSYFNLDGAGQGDILNHTLQIDADAINEVDDALIPTGSLMPVVSTPFDFTTGQKIGDRIGEDHLQIKIGNGYDHNYILNNYSEKLRQVGTVISSDNQVIMQISTTEPGMQLYTGNFLDIIGKGGKHYGNRSAFCLETQHFPDSPNQPNFPSTVLKPNEVYESETVYGFGE